MSKKHKISIILPPKTSHGKSNRRGEKERGPFWIMYVQDMRGGNIKSFNFRGDKTWRVLKSLKTF